MRGAGECWDSLLWLRVTVAGLLLFMVGSALDLLGTRTGFLCSSFLTTVEDNLSAKFQCDGKWEGAPFL